MISKGTVFLSTKICHVGTRDTPSEMLDLPCFKRKLNFFFFQSPHRLNATDHQTLYISNFTFFSIVCAHTHIKRHHTTMNIPPNQVIKSINSLSFDFIRSCIVARSLVFFYALRWFIVHFIHQYRCIDNCLFEWRDREGSTGGPRSKTQENDREFPFSFNSREISKFGNVNGNLTNLILTCRQGNHLVIVQNPKWKQKKWFLVSLFSFRFWKHEAGTCVIIAFLGRFFRVTFNTDISANMCVWEREYTNTFKNNGAIC